MDFIDNLRQFSNEARDKCQYLKTEEATKITLIMPFFQTVLGYDTSNPLEFVPEYDADIAIKKYEKVDFAIMFDGVPTILVEAKKCSEPLEKHDAQLFHYFVATDARFGILTNGLIYKFYTDIDKSHKMDLTPFLEFDILNIEEPLVPELKRFCKSNFDANAIHGRASEMKYSNKIKEHFRAQLEHPSDDFIRYMLSQVYDGSRTAAAVEKFRPVVEATLNALIGEIMNERITKALKSDTESPSDTASANEEQPDSVEAEPMEADAPRKQVITTDEELQAYYIVKALLMSEVDISLINYRDTLSYFTILHHDMPTHWICRLRLTRYAKSIAFPTEAGAEVRHELSGLDVIYNHRDALITSAKRFY